MNPTIRIGTRRSKLALWQANWVADKLRTSGCNCELKAMDTKGDRMIDVPIPKIGSKGVFTEELESQLDRGIIDLAVHSAKDMPSRLPHGFEIIAFTPREKPHDVLVATDAVKDLKGVRTIGTSSTRRVALLKRFYPQIKSMPVRGNLQTRIEKMQSGKMDALILAYAGVERLGISEMVQFEFPVDTFVPAVGQGSMAIEVSKNLETNLKETIRSAINHPETESCLLAERSFLYTIQGGCSIPAFALARLYGNGIQMTAGIVSLDGSDLVQFNQSGTQEQALDMGANLAQQVLNAGGKDILQKIKEQQHSNEDQI